MAASTSASRSSNGIFIIGGGLAGLFCALKLAPLPATILTQTPLGEGASAWAQGGIAAAIGEGDTAEDHAADTIAAGAGIVDTDIAHLLAKEASDRIHDLLEYGVPFDRDLEGRLKLSREAAHRARRIVRVGGDLAGKAIMQALSAAVRAAPSIKVVEGWSLIGLINENGNVVGAYGTTSDGRASTVRSSALVLATGGIGHLYAVTTNPLNACGVGLAAAARAGAVVADPEFVQFHPTGMDLGRDPAPLATEALRGDGAILINRSGKRFMLDVHPDAELGPRDVVARAVFREISEGRGAFLDARTAIGEKFPHMFPTVHATCVAAGIDPVTQPIPVAPAAHYHMGGVKTDEDGRTSLPGLWACGEVSSTGAHGANRLASNSLLEAVVFGARIAADIAQCAQPTHHAELEAGSHALSPSGDVAIIDEIRSLMTRYVGVLRNAEGLKVVLRRLREIEQSRSTSETTRNVAVVGMLVAAAALSREESRGGHARTDYPQARDQFAHRTFLTLEDARALADEASGTLMEAAV